MTTQEHQQQAQKHQAQDARKWLLATIPVTERRLEATGVSTTMLEGGDGPPIVSYDTHAKVHACVYLTSYYGLSGRR